MIVSKLFSFPSLGISEPVSPEEFRRQVEALTANRKARPLKSTVAKKPSVDPAEMGVIYFVRAGVMGSIKIGFTTQLSSRISQLQTGCAQRLLLLGATDGTRQDEKRWHARFA